MWNLNIRVLLLLYLNTWIDSRFGCQLQGDIMTVEKVVEAVSDFVNAMSSNTAKFAEEFAKQHRTLQQSFTRLCWVWFVNLSKREQFDRRNEASVELAKKIVNQFKDEAYLPLIYLQIQ